MFFSADDRAPLALDLLPDWKARFGAAAARLELEVGPGHGGFALAFARAHPERALVAVEQRRKFAEEIADRARRRGLSNLLVLHGDARILLPRLFSPQSLAAVHVHFPDPWWKRKHEGRRLVDERMSLLLRALLSPGGLLDIRTDVEEYALWAAAGLESAGFRNEAGPGGFTGPDPTDIPSSREKRYLATGQRVWRLRLRR
ncbi:MAG TPA: tRNA (guanine-N7)-methyltransferase [Anaeromyxobacter sp.]|nr:tRNA (guanine-N7)-methyltransferase [Anaeromyxobacter sp.]